MFDDLDDPRKQALLMASLGLLGGGGGRGVGGFARDVSRAGLLGLQGYNQASMAKDRRAEEEQQRRLREMQITQAQRGMDYQNNYDALAKSHFSPGAPAVNPLTPNDDNGNPMPSFPAQAPKMDMQGFMQGLPALGGQGVKDALAIQQTMLKDNAFGKVDPKDYTAESVRKFMASGARDYSLLEPVRKKEVVDGTVFDPYAAPAGSQVFGAQSKVVPDGKGGFVYNQAHISPVEQARLGIAQAELGLNFAKARDEGIGSSGLSAKGQREIQQRVGEKGAIDTLNAKAELPNTISNAAQTSGLIADLINHPGMRDAVGFFKKGGATLNNIPFVENAYAPGSDAADFKARLDQISGQSFLAAYQKLKGGGQITEVEGKKATEAVNRMKTSQSVAEFQRAALELDGMLKQAVNIAKQKAGVKSNGGWSIQRVD